MPVRAAYAPIPERQQAKWWSVTLGASAFYDTNIFGAPAGEIDSMVYQLSPKFAASASVSQQTFLAASYQLTLDRIDDRPGDRTLDSHDLSLRLAHAFRPGTTIDLTEGFQVAKNPESLLAGIPLNTDQSFRRNQFDARFDHALNPRLQGALKARHILYSYDNDTLADSLDRREILLGASAAFDVQPVTKLAGEYRYQDVAYDTNGSTKDKESHFTLVGVDYAPGAQVLVSVRAGAEFRIRSGAPDDDSPYVEVSGKYDYGDQSFISGGYTYTIEETSNVAAYTDTRVHRIFANLQHALRPAIIGSASATVESGSLQARTGANIDDMTFRLGGALTYVGRRDWSVSGTIDYDYVDSDDPSREMERVRAGVTVRFLY